MSYDEQDRMADDFEEMLYNEFGPQWASDHAKEIYEENYDAAVKEFTNERLRSYYEAQPLVAQPAVNVLNYAQELLQDHPRAALVFAASAVELIWKEVLLRPMLHGLIHAPSLSPVIVEIATHNLGFHRFEKLLIEMLKHVSGYDFSIVLRKGSTLTLTQEIKRVASIRNNVLHAGYEATPDEASLAINVAETLLGVYTGVVNTLRIRLSDDQIKILERTTSRRTQN